MPDDRFADDLSELVTSDDGQCASGPDAAEEPGTRAAENPTRRRVVVEFALATSLGGHDDAEYALDDADELAAYHYRKADEAADDGDPEEARNHRTLGQLFEGVYERYARTRPDEVEKRRITC